MESLRKHFKVLGLEAYKSSKMSGPRLEDCTFFDLLKMGHGHDLFSLYLGKRQKPRRKFAKTFWRTPDFFAQNRRLLARRLFFWRSEKNFRKPFFFGEHLRLVSLSILILGFERVCSREVGPWPWPRIFFVLLALASKVVSSTPPVADLGGGMHPPPPA